MLGVFRKKHRLLPLVAIIIVSFTSKAQTSTHTDNHQVRFKIPQVALLSLVQQQELNLEISGPQESGQSVLHQTTGTDTFWINYTYIGPRNGQLTARIINGDPGVQVKLRVMENGMQWPPSSTTLSSTEQTIQANLLNAYTGRGYGKGIPCRYEVEEADLLPESGEQYLTILYTLFVQ